MISVNEERALLGFAEKIATEKNVPVILDFLFDTFQEIIPYDRIGIALIEEDNQVRLRWARSRLKVHDLPTGYTAPLDQSSLAQLIERDEPRIIGDLNEYQLRHPESESTQRILRDGIRSNLTCLLKSANGPIGFIFFSSQTPHCYNPSHARSFQLIAAHVSVLIDGVPREGPLVHGGTVKDPFVTQVMHDLKNPVGVIRGYADLLLSGAFGQLTARAQDAVRSVSQQSETLLSLISDIQDLSVLNTNRFSLHQVPVSLRPFFDDFFAASRIVAERKGLHLEMELVDIPETADFDPLRINQVLSNLVSNAMKFSPRGSVVTLKVQAVSDELQISVRDAGPGIPPDEVNKIFLPFGRTSVRPVDRQESSTGLGLFICRQLVEAHHGHIGFDSKVGVGSTFHFTLPLRRS